MVQALELIAFQPQHVVNRIVEVAANAGRTETGSLSFEIQHLPHHPGFPEKIAIEPTPMLLDRFSKLRDHAEAEETISSNVLMAAQPLRLFSAVCFDEQVQWKIS